MPVFLIIGAVISSKPQKGQRGRSALHLTGHFERVGYYCQRLNMGCGEA